MAELPEVRNSAPCGVVDEAVLGNSHGIQDLNKVE